ncbi:molybdopterin molybdotransferase MoeA [Halobacteriovorax sp.]|uniref:molybdopterin molybdotransferase MoeA n=1 Tax=Halobacteriovorax sp. TaxID=2020862 RepID=UPI00356A9F49
MISATEAHRIIQSSNIPDNLIKVIDIELESANGLYLAEDIYATRNQPPFNRSMMDGIAISSKNDSKSYRCESIARAGFEQLELKDSDCCIEVMTGAPVPSGCDCVIPYEEVHKVNDTFELKDKDYPVAAHKFIHREGSDYKVGDLLLVKGVIINSTIISLLSSIGLSSVKVFELNSIAIVSTGDELIEPGEGLETHQIYRSNPYAIRSELLNFFPKSEIKLFHLDDDEKEVLSGLANILENHKIVIISGGVSKGKYDYIPRSLKTLGVNELFHKVKQRPGKPLWFGSGSKGQIVFGLPGNPVSSLVNTRRHIIPLLEKFLNPKRSSNYSVKALVDREIGSSFTHFIPVSLSVVEGTIYAEPSTGNNSGDFSKLVFSKGLIEVPSDEGRIIKDKLYQFFPWGSLEVHL